MIFRVWSLSSTGALVWVGRKWKWKREWQATGTREADRTDSGRRPCLGGWGLSGVSRVAAGGTKEAASVVSGRQIVLTLTNGLGPFP